jgi:hypothetical protein
MSYIEQSGAGDLALISKVLACLELNSPRWWPVRLSFPFELPEGNLAQNRIKIALHHMNSSQGITRRIQSEGGLHLVSLPQLS